MTFEELNNGDCFTDLHGIPYEKVEIYCARNKLTQKLQHYNAVSLWDFEECFFNSDEFVYDYLT